MELLKIVNILDADDKVGMVLITLSADNKWNNEILVKMMNRYQNMYDIYLVDKN